ncbi:hypothetical protein [Sphingomonas koreensis]|uniref:hypothetical protein n=1 Tax=Sphingomonas koreensis TaxID=93064 RepID=UPI00234F6D16|nr:hypothetical protein [Sphingomonas koreensis]MDC7812841.1 hypothetical protein [Sphingomonas koreensis]
MAASEFERQLRKHAGRSQSPALNLTHVTSHATMMTILREGAFRSDRDCKVYGEKLVYTFYGRAAYRPMRSREDLVYDDVIYAPVCFLVKPLVIGDARRALPFDSGGYVHYGPTMHPSWTKDDFEIGCTPESVTAVISTFWASDADYLSARPIMAIDIPASHDRLRQYHRLITAALPKKFDTRCSTVELQFTVPLALGDRIAAVIVPDEAIDEDLTEFAVELGAELIPYRYETPFRPEDFLRSIHFAVQDYYRPGFPV